MGPNPANEAYVWPEAESFSDSRAEALNERVRVIDEPEDRRLGGGGLEVECNRAATPVQDGMLAAAAGILRAVDADDVGAEVGEDHSAERSGAEATELDDPQPGEGTGGHHRPMFFAMMVFMTSLVPP